MPNATHRLNNNESKAKAVVLLASGESQRAVARKLGVSQPTISRFSRREDIKPLIEKTAAILVQQGLAPAVDMVLETVYETLEQGVRDDDHNRMKNLLQLRKLGLQVSENILRSAGILPTHAPAPVIQNIVVRNEPVLAPAVRDLLITHAKLALDPRGE